MSNIKKYSLVFGICLVLGVGVVVLTSIDGSEPVDDAGFYIALIVMMAAAQPTIKRRVKSYLKRKKTQTIALIFR